MNYPICIYIYSVYRDTRGINVDHEISLEVNFSATS